MDLDNYLLNPLCLPLKYYMNNLIQSLPIYHNYLQQKAVGYSFIHVHPRDFFLAFLGKGPSPRALWYGDFIGIQQQIGKIKSNENISNFLQRGSRITCSHIILYHLTYRVLATNFKTCFRDSFLGASWRPRMKNMRTGIRI